MTTVTVEQVEADFLAVLGDLHEGEELVVLQGQIPVATLCKPDSPRSQPIFGSCRGMLSICEEDNEHLDDFEKEWGIGYTRIVGYR